MLNFVTKRNINEKEIKVLLVIHWLKHDDCGMQQHQ